MALTTTLFAFFNLSIAISIFFGNFFIDKIKKLSIICLWAASSLIVTLLLIDVSNFYHMVVLIGIEGAFLGLTILSFNLIFYSRTHIAERGRVGSVIISLSLMLTVALSLFLNTSHGTLIISIMLTIMTLTATFLNPHQERLQTTKRSYFDKRNFILYLIPWILFCINNSTFLITAFYQSQIYFPELTNLMNFFRYLTVSFGALIGGFLADKVGRKKVLELAFTILGFSFVLFGLIPISTTFIIVHMINAFSLGILLVIYYLFLWGEFSPRTRHSLCFSIGLSTFHFANFLGVIISPLLKEIKFETLVLLGSALLFAAILPIIVAKETLPLSQRSDIIDVKKHVERIQRELRKIRRR